MLGDSPLMQNKETSSRSLLFNRSGISCHSHLELWTHLVTLPSPWLLGVSHLQPVILFCENQAPLHIAANPFFQKWTKHIEPDCHIIHEKLQSGLIHTGYFPTTQLLAYVFIKPLGTISFSSPSLQVGCPWFSQFNLRTWVLRSLTHCNCVTMHNYFSVFVRSDMWTTHCDSFWLNQPIIVVAVVTFQSNRNDQIMYSINNSSSH